MLDDILATTLALIDHGERTHVRLGASGAYRWTECLGSILGSVGISTYSSEFAREGTAGHEMAQMCLENNQEAIEWIGRTIDGFEIDLDWAEAIQEFLDTCREFTKPGWTWWIEKPITLESLNPPEEMRGIADFCAFNADLKQLVVIDLKFGKGIEVDAKDNPQLYYYALGVLLSLPPEMHVEQVIAYIVQPRIAYGQHVKPTVIDPMSLIEWSVWLLERARLALEPNAPLKAGHWCRFCPLSGNCKEQAADAFRFAADEFDIFTIDAETPVPQLQDVRTLTPQQIAGILNVAPQFRAFVGAVEEVAKEGMRRGWLTVPGWQVTEGEGRAKFVGVDEDSIAANIQSTFGLTVDQIYSKKLKTPPQIRGEIANKLRTNGLKKKEAEEDAKQLIEPFVTRPSTGVKLVPVASGRTPARLPGEEFPLLEAPTP